MASTCTLIWYTITNLSALKLNKERQFAWPIISLLGIIACVALLLSLPLWSVLGAVVLLAILVVIRLIIIRLIQKAAVDTSGNWSVTGLTLAQGDIISVTSQYAGEAVSATASAVVAAAPLQTAAPVISLPVTEADTTVSGKAPPGANVVFYVNEAAQKAVTANGGNWTVSGLTLAQGDLISVTAQSTGETVSMTTTTTVTPAPFETTKLAISGAITADNTTVSGRAPSGASVVLSINGKIRSKVIATSGKIVSTAATTKVAPTPLQTTAPVISGIMKAGDKTISGTAPSGANVVLSINGAAQPVVIATRGNWMVPGLSLNQGDTISVTAQSAGESLSAAAITQVQ